MEMWSEFDYYAYYPDHVCIDLGWGCDKWISSWWRQKIPCLKDPARNSGELTPCGVSSSVAFRIPDKSLLAP